MATEAVAAAGAATALYWWRRERVLCGAGGPRSAVLRPQQDRFSKTHQPPSTWMEVWSAASDALLQRSWVLNSLSCLQAMYFFAEALRCQQALSHVQLTSCSAPAEHPVVQVCIWRDPGALEDCRPADRPRVPGTS